MIGFPRIFRDLFLPKRRKRTAAGRPPAGEPPSGEEIVARAADRREAEKTDDVARSKPGAR